MVQRILTDVVPAYEVRAFGSRVHGRGLKPFSDIDLAIISQIPLPSHVLGELKERFDASDLPYKVDVVDYAAASPQFQAIIEQDYEVIQQLKPKIRH
ncbi:MAG: nucleotidyltransferase domain-containing protein [Mariprofundaceae bacterium]|nr:nucleotidyltransferase domain-containing protein [Mariprofundaceae bacterium]